MAPTMGLAGSAPALTETKSKWFAAARWASPLSCRLFQDPIPSGRVLRLHVSWPPEPVLAGGLTIYSGVRSPTERRADSQRK